jgi:hypothetical protein
MLFDGPHPNARVPSWSFCFNGLGLTTLPNQPDERGEHFAPSCPEVIVILYHAKEMSELSYSCGQFNCKYCLHLITLRFNAVSCEYVTQVFYLKCAEC